MNRREVLMSGIAGLPFLAKPIQAFSESLQTSSFDEVVDFILWKMKFLDYVVQFDVDLLEMRHILENPLFVEEIKRIIAFGEKYKIEDMKSFVWDDLSSNWEIYVYNRCCSNVHPSMIWEPAVILTRPNLQTPEM